MDRQQQRDIEWDCAQVVTRFYNALDASRYDDLVDQFAPDGIWKRQGEELAGRDVILAAMQARSDTQVIRHVVTNIEINVVDEDNASSAEYVTIYRHDSGEKLDGPAPLDGPGVIFLYQDKLIRTGDGWKIADKRGRPIMLRKRAK
jgi:hypothetical protein